MKGHVYCITDDDILDLKLNSKFELREVSDGAGFFERAKMKQPDYPAGAPQVYQLRQEDCNNWVMSLMNSHHFDWMQYKTVMVNKIEVGHYIPPHIDNFQKLRDRYPNVDHSKYEAIRVIVFVQDRKIGHILELNGVVMDYKQGDWITIEPGTIHFAANLGFTDRYTVQISGFRLRG